MTAMKNRYALAFASSVSLCRYGGSGDVWMPTVLIGYHGSAAAFSVYGVSVFLYPSRGRPVPRRIGVSYNRSILSSLAFVPAGYRACKDDYDQ
jgi:hypothetical protein